MMPNNDFPTQYIFEILIPMMIFFGSICYILTEIDTAALEHIAAERNIQRARERERESERERERENGRYRKRDIKKENDNEK